MEQPLVSVIVVSYNHSKYIRENLDSIKAQTYPNIELIVADDASADNSVEVFEAWLSENHYPAKKIFHKQNTGLATTLNECLELITGKYVKLIAADDFLHPESIAQCVAKLEELGEEFGMVFTDFYTVDDNSEIQEDIANYSEIGNVSPEQFSHDLISKGNRIAALTVLIKVEAIKKTGKYNAKFIVEDYFRWLKINELYKIAYIDQKLAYYRLHETNISKSKADKIHNETIILQMMFDKKGIAKQKINHYIWSKFKNNQIIDKNIITTYQKYPFRNKKLSFFIKYGISYKFYNLLSKFSMV